MTFNPIDNERYVRMAAHALQRSRSLEAPRPLPAAREAPLRTAVPILLLRPTEDLVGPAIIRISERAERVTKAVAAEQQRVDEARSQVKHETRMVKVDSPYGKSTNGQDEVERVIDTIDLMLRSHQIDGGQEAAARRVQDAWALAPNALRCALAPGAGGGVPGSGSITERQEWAGGVLNDVRNALGELDAPIVIHIAGIGWSVEETARTVFSVPSGVKVKAYQTAHVGMRFRMGIAVLSKRWRVEGKGGAKVSGVRGAVAGHDNTQNLGAMSEGERERHMPLRTAAEQRDVRLKKKAKRKKAKADARH